MSVNLPISILQDYELSEIQRSDKPAYLEHFQERQIYEQTLSIPFPYTEADADRWLAFVDEQTKRLGRTIHFAIREKRTKFLIGGVGFNTYSNQEKSHQAEIGYWLAKRYWNRGIVTAAVKEVVKVGFQEFELSRITAHIFDFNIASQRVLEKSGFSFEGLLKRHYQKQGKFFDAKLFARIR